MLKSSDDKITDELLKKTARSIYLVVPLFPQALKKPISLAYLFARAIDSIADKLIISPAEKLSLIHHLMQMIKTGLYLPENQQFEQAMHALQPPENGLLIHFEHLLEALYQFDEETRREIIWVLEKIEKGIDFDIKTFASTNEITCLATIEELDKYTYLVAGDVGEFLTRLSLLKLKYFSHRNPEELYQLSISGGKGLQLVNILRDIPDDFKEGRCYFPKQQLDQFNIKIEDARMNMQLLEPIVLYWRQRAIKQLRDGWQYMLSINDRGMSGAWAFMLLLGFATLQKLDDSDYLKTREHIKVNRRLVKVIMLLTALGMVSRRLFWFTRVMKFSSLMFTHEGNLNQEK